MDEIELEQRLRRRLHDRFDKAELPDALRQIVTNSLTPQARRTRWPSFAGFLSVGRFAAAAAVIVVVALGAFVVFSSGPVGPGGPTPSTSAISTAAASATPAPTSKESPSASAVSLPPTPAPSSAAAAGSVPPVSTTAWTGLDVNALAGAPSGMQAIVPWTGGYIGFSASISTGTTTAWVSSDGRAWTQLPAGTFGLNGASASAPSSPVPAPASPSGDAIFLDGASCRDRVLIHTSVGSGQSLLWSSSDSITWTPGALPGQGFGKQPGLAGSAGGAIIAADKGLAVQYTTDCTTWQHAALPGPAQGTVTGVAAFDGGFVAVGFSGQSGSANTQPLAWWSADGAHWSAATVPAHRGEGFQSVRPGSAGLVAESSQPGSVPGLQSLWTSPDGHAWAPSATDPLGTIASGEGVGSAAGSFVGDGQRLLAYGSQGGGNGPIEYWISSDGTAWTRLDLAGSGVAGLAADTSAQPFLMRDGVLFSGTSGTWFGNVVGH